VIDVSGAVFIYDNTGAFLGQWTPLNVGKPEGIAVWGNDLWLVDPNSDKVYKFTGGAARRTGKVAATSSFALNSGNLNSTDIVTDGAHLWVLNDTLAADKVFRYTSAGVLEGSWTLSTTNPSPTGLTIDPHDVNHIWVVDASTDKVYQYNGATTRLTGIIRNHPPRSISQRPTQTHRASRIRCPPDPDYLPRRMCPTVPLWQSRSFPRPDHLQSRIFRRRFEASLTRRPSSIPQQS
jgi:hypothetical protein